MRERGEGGSEGRREGEGGGVEEGEQRSNMMEKTIFASLFFFFYYFGLDGIHRRSLFKHANVASLETFPLLPAAHQLPLVEYPQSRLRDTLLLGPLRSRKQQKPPSSLFPPSYSLFLPIPSSLLKKMFPSLPFTSTCLPFLSSSLPSLLLPPSFP